ncbi:MAG: RseA family anti-sigma factor [Endozoicomonas sp. (ex Botrylloides leachii)]|nr:RseA family anti-sigma factor [Endozoicomonas sp. (ex Botrylloides leachii)]
MSNKISEGRAKERLYESLSAVMDTQVSELELHRVLSGIASDKDVRKKAMHYQRIGDSIRNETNRFSDVDLTASINRAIEAEVVLNTPASGVPSDRTRSFMRAFKKWTGRHESFGKVAVAASVFFAVILGSRNYFSPQDDLAFTASTSVSPSTATLVQPIQLSTKGYAASGILAGYPSHKHDTIPPEQLAYAQSIADIATRERFRAYALQHAELSVMSTGQSVLPFARLTSFDVQ